MMYGNFTERELDAFWLGVENEQTRIITLLEGDICSDWTVDCCDGACSAYKDAITLIKGKNK